MGMHAQCDLSDRLIMTFFKSFFLMWAIFKVFIEFAKTLFLFYVLVFWP